MPGSSTNLLSGPGKVAEGSRLSTGAGLPSTPRCTGGQLCCRAQHPPAPTAAQKVPKKLRNRSPSTEATNLPLPRSPVRLKHHSWLVSKPFPARAGELHWIHFPATLFLRAVLKSQKQRSPRQTPLKALHLIVLPWVPALPSTCRRMSRRVMERPAASRYP